MFGGVFNDSIIYRASQKGLVDIHIKDLRGFGIGPHRVVDDSPYGGGGGMILKPEPIAEALNTISDPGHVVITTPRGRLFRHADAYRLSTLPDLTIICGHYEGIDERVTSLFAHEELSIGDYVLTGGEIPAMAIVDAVVRLIPAVLGQDPFISGDSHYDGLLEHPQYTRPREFMGIKVPDILLSGDHERIAKWRRDKALEKTLSVRPDMLDNPKQSKGEN